MKPDISVLVCTYNRADDLAILLESLCNQDGCGFTYEVVVVDNNSTDSTRDRVEEVCEHAQVVPRYLFEARQGKSYALNRGLAAIRATRCLVIDDDQTVPQGYLALLLKTFGDHPDVSFIGGKVLPIWEIPPPEWLTKEHWAPLGMADYGDEPFFVDQHRQVCLLTFAFDVEAVIGAGGFRDDLGVMGNQMGSTEDAELIQRLIATGRKGLYWPELLLHHHAPSNRMTREYYRRWHFGHGGYYAQWRNVEVESSRFRILDVPGHIFRQMLRDVGNLIYNYLIGDSKATFALQLRLCFSHGFIRRRWAQHRANI